MHLYANTPTCTEKYKLATGVFIVAKSVHLNFSWNLNVRKWNIRITCGLRWAWQKWNCVKCMNVWHFSFAQKCAHPLDVDWEQHHYYHVPCTVQYTAYRIHLAEIDWACDLMWNVCLSHILQMKQHKNTAILCNCEFMSIDIYVINIFKWLSCYSFGSLIPDQNALEKLPL